MNIKKENHIVKIVMDLLYVNIINLNHYVKSAEEYYYRSLFTMNYGLAAVRVILPYRWMPKWCPETTDPSARTLASYVDPA